MCEKNIQRGKKLKKLRPRATVLEREKSALKVI